MAALLPSHADDLARCVHCGFCLQACPTYLLTGAETESPRGRIQLARALEEDRIPVSSGLAAHFDLCLGCQACVTACPSGVPYGRIIEHARETVLDSEAAPRSWRVRVRLLRLLLGRPALIRNLVSLTRIYQKSPLLGRISRLLPGRLRELERALPKLPAHSFVPPAQSLKEAAEAKRSAALLTGCVMQHLYPETHQATLRVLERNGTSTSVPATQGCCGALLLHLGDRDGARRLAKVNIDCFSSQPTDFILVNAAGCGSAMKEYGELLATDTAYAKKAADFSSRVRDVNELLAETGVEPPRAELDTVATYQDSCHLIHAQGISDAPRKILQAIPGLEFKEMPSSDRCCGSAGIYNLTQPAVSRQLLAEKVRDIESTGAETVTTSNPGCVLQLQMGLGQVTPRREVVHVVDLLDRAYRAEEAERAD